MTLGDGLGGRWAKGPKHGLDMTANEATSARRSSFSFEDLMACARGDLFGAGNAQLPAPPMLMMHRITEISETGGANQKGGLVAEYDVTPDDWYFKCHFLGDPVMPGCLGLDALWQMVGFFLGWLGEPGRGRALGVGEVKFTGMVLPTAKTLRYRVDFTRVIRRRLVLGVADGAVEADGETVFTTKDMRVGVFKDGDAPAG